MITNRTAKRPSASSEPMPACMDFMAQRAHSQITSVKAGHLSMITQPWAVASVINQAARSAS
jgi:hypothetical protein